MEFQIDSHPLEDREKEEERLLQLESCLEKLLEKQQRSVKLFFLEEKCYKEVGGNNGLRGKRS